MRKLNSGFTLVELMVVITILGILMSFLMVGVAVVRRQAKARQTELNMKIIEQAASNYQMDHRDFPGNGGMSNVPADSSAVLLDGLMNGTGRWAPYIRKGDVPTGSKDEKEVFLDPWEEPIAYKHPAAYMRRPPKADSIRLYSAGPDKNFKTEDDNIVNWPREDFPDTPLAP